MAIKRGSVTVGMTTITFPSWLAKTAALVIVSWYAWYAFGFSVEAGLVGIAVSLVIFCGLMIGTRKKRRAMRRRHDHNSKMTTIALPSWLAKIAVPGVVLWLGWLAFVSFGPFWGLFVTLGLLCGLVIITIRRRGSPRR